MVSLTFVFDKEKVLAAGTTEDELLAPMREHAKKYGISEDEYGVFSKDGEDAYCDLGMIVPELVTKNPKYIDFLKEWIFDVEGEKEDCLEAFHRWYIDHGEEYWEKNG